MVKSVCCTKCVLLTGGEWGSPLGVHRREAEPRGSPEGGTAKGRCGPLAGSVPGGEGALPLCVRLLVWKRPQKGPAAHRLLPRAAGSVPQHRLQDALGQGWAMAPRPSTLLGLGESGGAGAGFQGQSGSTQP